jgi:hypothetical protein
VQEIKDAQDSFPADLTNLLAAVAPTFSTSTSYSAGAYVWQGGKLYRFTAAHPAGTWTGTDAAAVALGNDVGDLKSSFVPTDVPNDGIAHGEFRLRAIWRRGSRNSATAISNAKYRITTLEQIHVLEDTPMKIKGGFRYNLYMYSYATGEYVSASGWSNASFTLSPDYLYHINIARTSINEDTSETADIALFSSKMYAALTDTTLTTSGMAADAAATGTALAGKKDVGYDGLYAVMSCNLPITIDTVNKTMSCGTLIIKCGSYRKNNPTIDFSGLDAGAYQTIYFDFDDETIKVIGYTSYQNLSNVNRTAIIGNVYKSGTRYPKGFFTFNTPNDIIVNGVKQVSYTNHFRTTKLDAFGDSICAGRTDGDGTATYTDTLLQSVLGTQLGITATNHAIGGKCWQKHSDTGDVGYQIAQSGALSGDFVLFFAGTNDYGKDGGTPIGTIADAPAFETGGTFYAALHYAIQYVLTQKPNMEIALVTPTFRNYYGSNANKIGNAYTTVTNLSGHTLGDYCDAIVEIGKYYNIPVLDMRLNSPINQFNYASMLTEESGGVAGRYLHPLNATYAILYGKIASWLDSVL